MIKFGHFWLFLAGFGLFLEPMTYFMDHSEDIQILDLKGHMVKNLNQTNFLINIIYKFLIFFSVCDKL